MYLHRHDDMYTDDDGSESDQPIIDPFLLAVSPLSPLAALAPSVMGNDSASQETLAKQMAPPTYMHAKNCAVDAFEELMTFSSSSKCIVTSSPLHSTFKLPEHAYSRMTDPPLIMWELADDARGRAKTHGELVNELDATCCELCKAKLLVERAVEPIDATNAQLALSGMYVRKSQKQ